MAKEKNEDLSLNALYKERLNTLADIQKLKESGKNLSNAESSILKDNISKLKKYNDLIKDVNSELKNNLSNYESAESSISGMSSLMSGLKNNLSSISKEGISLAQSLQDVGSANREMFNQASEAAANAIGTLASLSQLNAEDTAQIATKRAEYESYFSSLSSQIEELEALQVDGRTKEGKAIRAQIEGLKSIGAQIDSNYAAAAQFSNVSKETKEVYEDLTSDLESLNNTFKKVAITTQVFFSSFKNAAGMSLMYIGGLVDDFNELSKGVGGTVTQMFQLKAQSFAVSKLLGQEAGTAVTSLSEKLGDANRISNSTALGIGAMTSRLGIGGEEAATLVNQFGNLSGKSNEVAMNTMEATSQLASANGVAPSRVMSDIAQNTEFFALYAKDGGANIAEAAIQARRLGVDLGTASKISDSLLDYQSSVQSEMQASVLLGRNLNLNKARELAYAGDSAGAMKEALRAAGDLAAFEKMGPYEKRALAEAIGVGVDELQKMIANEKHANTQVGKMEAKFDSINGAVREMAAGVAGTAVKGIGGMLIGMKDFKTQVSDAKEGFNFIKDSAKGIGSFLTGGGLGKLSEATTLDKNKTPGASVPSGGKGGGKATGGNQQSQMAKGLKEMGKPGVGMGILNTALAGPAFLLYSLGTPGMMAMSAFGTPAGIGLKGLATGLKGFGKVSIASVGVLAATGLAFAVMTAGSIGLAAVALLGAPAGAGLSALSVGLRALGKAGIAAVQGIGILGLFGIALIPLAYGLSLLGPIIESVAGGLIGIIDSIGTGIATVVGSITTMMTSILPLLSMDAAGALFAVAGGFLAVSSALMAFAGASLLATPGMLAVGAFTALGGDKLLGGGESGGGAGGGEKDSLLEEIKGLRADMQAQPIIVQLDGRQVYMSNLRQQKNKSN